VQLAEIIGCQIVVAGKKLLIVQKQLYDSRGIFQFLVLRHKTKVILDFRFNKLISTYNYKKTSKCK